MQKIIKMEVKENDESLLNQGKGFLVLYMNDHFFVVKGVPNKKAIENLAKLKLVQSIFVKEGIMESKMKNIHQVEQFVKKL